MWKYRVGDPVTHIEHPTYKGVIIELRTCEEVCGDGGDEPWYQITWVVSHVDTPWFGNEAQGSLNLLK